MKALRFEWDEEENRKNQRQHSVSFAEAQTVFFDEHAVEFYDDEHSEWEDRFLLLGISTKLRVLLVCHCRRESGSIIRIISARKATKNERRLYLKGVS
ncbi:MAG: BrnT family toxin [Lentisphaerae bacterium]|nr:BrnT family toxin [Lentisphaerota bacterium]